MNDFFKRYGMTLDRLKEQHPEAYKKMQEEIDKLKSEGKIVDEFMDHRDEK